jgi:hypothetical protein
MDRRISTGAGHGKTALIKQSTKRTKRCSVETFYIYIGREPSSMSISPIISPAWIGKAVSPPTVEWQREPEVSYALKQCKAEHMGKYFLRKV